MERSSKQSHNCMSRLSHWVVRQPQWGDSQAYLQIRLVHDDAAGVLQLSCLREYDRPRTRSETM
jgi:hypothetical protein